MVIYTFQKNLKIENTSIFKPQNFWQIPFTPTILKDLMWSLSLSTWTTIIAPQIWFSSELNRWDEMRSSREEIQKERNQKTRTLTYIMLTQVNKRRDSTATFHYAGGCFHFITKINSEQKVTEYWHFNQGNFT